MAIPQGLFRVFTGTDRGNLTAAAGLLTRLLARNIETTARGVPIFTYAEVITVTSVRDRLLQIADKTQPLIGA